MNLWSDWSSLERYLKTVEGCESSCCNWRTGRCCSKPSYTYYEWNIPHRDVIPISLPVCSETVDHIMVGYNALVPLMDSLNNTIRSPDPSIIHWNICKHFGPVTIDGFDISLVETAWHVFLLSQTVLLLLSSWLIKAVVYYEAQMMRINCSYRKQTSMKTLHLATVTLVERQNPCYTKRKFNGQFNNVVRQKNPPNLQTSVCILHFQCIM